MPIEFACDCGKKFKVPDEYAGKRSKCTACGNPVLVPTPPPPEPPATVEESAEDAALRALTEGDDPEPAPRTTSRYAGGYSSGYAGAAPSRPAAPPPPREDAGSHAARTLASTSTTTTKVSKPKAKKARSSGYGYDEPPHRGWSPNWLKVGGGALAILGGLVWIVVAWMAGRIFWYPFVLVFAGIFGIINGLLSRSGDA